MCLCNYEKIVVHHVTMSEFLCPMSSCFHLNCFLFILLSSTFRKLRYSHNARTYEQKVVKRALPGACVSTYSLSSLSEVVIRASPHSYARAASTQINRPAKTCRVGPSCLSSSRRWQCFQVHTRTIRGSDSTRFGQECLVGLNVRRPTARMQAVLLITPDLWELRNKS